MDTAELIKRGSADDERVREPEAPAPAPADVERLLGLQRSAGNASVSRLLGSPSAARAPRSRAISEADHALTRSLARTAAERSGVREADPGAESAPELEEDDPQEVEADELETEEESAPAETAAATGSRTLARAGGKGAKTKTPKPPKTPTIKSKTTFKAPDRSSKSRTTIAVGEKVTFTGDQAGAWAADAGVPVTGANGKTFVWTAPDRASSPTIKLTVGALSASKTMTVIEPATVTGKKVGSDTSFASGTQGAGMRLRFTYGPMNVSFGNVEVKEVSGPPSNITGYFTSVNVAGLWHASGDTFLAVASNNKDTAIDTASFSGFASPWTDGGWDWVIPYHFKTKTEAGDGKQFTTVTQAFTLEGPPNAGRSKVSKAGVSTKPRKP